MRLDTRITPFAKSKYNIINAKFITLQGYKTWIAGVLLKASLTLRVKGNIELQQSLCNRKIDCIA
jgi:hypothetical protein